MKFNRGEVHRRLLNRFTALYGDRAETCLKRLFMLIGRYGIGDSIPPDDSRWDQTDILMITYGDMVHTVDERPLVTLKKFSDERLQGAIKIIHILPFSPYSSDDGFSVIDYREVNQKFGRWKDIEAVGENFSLMFDLVLNHCSAQSEWFKDYLTSILPGRAYFIEADPETDLSAVTRPRKHPLLTEVKTRDGQRHVWTTFSADQVDLDFSNPDVLFEFLDILFLYILHGARILRLDAIAYLWKEIGTNCIHLPQTHEVVKLFRDVLDLVAPQVLLLTETNVPHKENVSYFGDGDEADVVYQFSLPPLLLHSLITGNGEALTGWAAQLGDAPPGCTFLNFTASHDGIGLRPLEGLVPPEALDNIADHAGVRGGHVSTKANSDGSESPYELNITYFDALSFPDDEEMSIRRFLCSQTIPLALKGIPAVYFHSLTGTRNDTEGVERFGYPRAINRHKWSLKELTEELDATDSLTARVFREYTRLLKKRGELLAFHPDGSQKVLDLGAAFFAVKRKSPDGNRSILAVSNLTSQEQTVSLEEHLPSRKSDKGWRDLLAEEERDGLGPNRILKLQPYQTVWLRVAKPNINQQRKKA